jgi:UDP-N-acetylmuramate dehydrogenase
MVSTDETRAVDGISLRGVLRERVSLANLTTYRIGGSARYLFAPLDATDIADFLAWAQREGLRSVILGLGSNVLFADGLLDLAVIHTAAAMTSMRQVDEDLFEADAGVSNRAFVEWLATLGVRGMEYLHDIPGTIGGAVVMNASNNHGETAEDLWEVGFVEAAAGQDSAQGRRAVCQRARRDLDFGYRRSAFGRTSDRIVTSARFRLRERGTPEEILTRVETLRAERVGKFPEETANCGSVFKRPPADFAGRLIEAAGCKGLKLGDARVSTRHAGFIVNQGAARAEDVRALIAQVQDRVLADSGVRLERELIYVE